jgi:hypothetical protein
MIMVLPFVIALLAIFFIMWGQAKTGLWLWVLLMGVYLSWCQYHMNDTLAITL